MDRFVALTGELAVCDGWSNYWSREGSEFHREIGLNSHRHSPLPGRTFVVIWQWLHLDGPSL